MTISDELRRWADVHCGEECEEYLGLLADRIDREMVELPRDKDGKVIHIGDVVYDSASGKRGIVKNLHLAERGVLWGVPTWGVSTFSDGFVDTSSLTHEFPDSWERIADELDEQAGSLTKDGYTWQEDAIHDFADRIRKLAAKKEDER